MREFYDDWKELKKIQKEERLKNANQEGWDKKTEYHWQTRLNGGICDYWPSTGRFRYLGKTYFGGVDGFVRSRR